MRFQCPNCKGLVAVDNGEAGKEVECGHCRTRVTVPRERTAPGSVFADFVIRKEIGRGGMGIVYLSHQISLDRPAALKILADTYAQNSDFVAGFVKEARSAAKLNHPNIVQAYAVGEDDGMYYFAMEYVEGRTMKEILDEKKILPVDQASLIIEQIADALDYAWKEAHLIHRDIKPDNIMLTDSGRAKLADLGLAKKAEEKDDLASEDEVMGTPQYISPEHLTGAPMDVRSDLYSLGATFYHFVTGQFPFQGENAVEIAKKHIEEELVPPIKINPKLSPEISAVIVKMMAKNPDDRYQTAEKLVDELRSLRKKKPVLQLKLQALSAASSHPSTQTGPLVSQTPSSAPKLTLKTPSGTAPASPAKEPEKKPEEKQEGPSSSDTSLQNTLSTQTGLQEVIEKKESSSRRKFILLIGGGVLLLLLIAGGAAAVFFKPLLKEKFSKYFGKKAETPVVVKTAPKVPVKKPLPPPPPPEPESTPYTVKADSILKNASEHQFDYAKITDECEEFLLKNSAPKYAAERQRHAQILALYAQAEEMLIGMKRTDLHDAVILKEKEAKRLAEQRRRDEQSRQEKERFAEAEKRRIEEKRRRDEAERKRLADAERKHAAEEHRRIVENGKREVMRDFAQIRLKVHADCRAGKYEDALAKLDRIIQIPGTLQGQPGEVVAFARNNAVSAQKIRKLVLSSQKFASFLDDPAAKDRIKGVSFVHKHKLAVVQSVDDGVITVTLGGKEQKLRIKSLSARERKDFVTKSAAAAGLENEMLVCYLLLNGEIAEAMDSLIFLPKGFDRSEFNQIAQEILNDQYRKATPQQKRAIEKKFGRPPFSSLRNRK